MKREPSAARAAPESRELRLPHACLDRFWVEWSLSFFVAPAKVELCSCVVKANKANSFPTAHLDPCFRRGDGKRKTHFNMKTV